MMTNAQLLRTQDAMRGFVVGKVVLYSLPIPSNQADHTGLFIFHLPTGMSEN
jgi:hypothetical protein